MDQTRSYTCIDLERLMGLIRKSRLMAEQERLQRAQLRVTAEATRIPALTGSHEERMAVLQKIREAANGATGVEASQRTWAATRQNAPRSLAPAPVLPPPGWYSDPDRDHLLRWWDGTDWTGRTAPRIG